MAHFEFSPFAKESVRYLVAMEKSTPPPTKVSFWHYINPVCLSAGIIGLALHYYLEMLDLGMTGLGLWGLTGIWGLQKEGVIK